MSTRIFIKTVLIKPHKRAVCRTKKECRYTSRLRGDTRLIDHPRCGLCQLLLGNRNGPTKRHHGAPRSKGLITAPKQKCGVRSRVLFVFIRLI